jgi:hypothetical protein
MAVVIDEVESTVEPEPTSAQPAGQSSGGQQNIPRDQLTAELHRIARRQARLKAD